MEFEINLDNKKRTVQLINKKRMKHCYLALKSSNHIQIRAHHFFTLEDAKNLLEQKEAWLIKNIKRMEQREAVKSVNYYLGEVIEHIEDIDAFYTQKAKEILPNLVQKHGQRMGMYPSDLKFRKNKSRFGSCSAKNSISLNILLMRYPLETIEYVIIHELAHIKHKNHSKKFWDLVEEYCPNYKLLDKSLKMF